MDPMQCIAKHNRTDTSESLFLLSIENEILKSIQYTLIDEFWKKMLFLYGSTTMI